MYQQDLSGIDVIARQYSAEKTPLIMILKSVQEKYGYLNENILTKVAQATNIPLSEIYGVATFYTLFTTTEKGDNIIRFCVNAPCHVKGAKDVSNSIKEYLQINYNETTKDKKFTLEATSCLGLCAVAPCMMINEETYGNLTPQKALSIIEEFKNKKGK